MDHRIDGIQVDLEPYNDRYVQPLKAFVGHLGKALRDEDSSKLLSDRNGTLKLSGRAFERDVPCGCL